MQIKQKPTNKIKRTKNNKSNNFLGVQNFLREWKLFVLRFGAFFMLKKKINKQINKIE